MESLASAIVCTHNRCDFLEGVVGSLAVQTLPPQQYEIIVVDNGSSDRTRLVVENMMRSSRVALRYIWEPSIGLSFARNAGWQAARGRIVAFCDDDALAEPTWLSSLLEVYERYPDAAGVGGRVKLLWDATRPAWLPAAYDYVYSATDLGPETHPLRPPEQPSGCNCSYRREILDLAGGFDGRLGRQGNSLWANEDSEFASRIGRQLGRPLYYAPAAIVYHHVQRARLTRGYVMRHEFWSSASGCSWEASTFGYVHPLRSALRGLVRAPIHLLRVAFCTLSGRHATAFYWLVAIVATGGNLFGLAQVAAQKLVSSESHRDAQVTADVAEQR